MRSHDRAIAPHREPGRTGVIGQPPLQQSVANRPGDVDLGLQTAITSDVRDFVAGRSLGALLPALVPDDEAATQVYLDLARPVAAALSDEFGPVTASRRLVIQVAAQAYSDHVFLTQKARRVLHAPVGKRGDIAKAVEAYSRAAERAAKAVLACLDALRRPQVGTINVRVGAATNLNVGNQQINVGRRRRKHRQPRTQ